MADKRILYVAQEVKPYLAETPESLIGNKIPQGIHAKKGFEVRVFMPKYGSINERRNQLHEVIRLSGMNIIIDDTDHPLIIKVASLQPSRIQVYFIDSDDFFQKSDSDIDDFGSNRNDNDERSIFFARGTMETVKKSSWSPSIVHCSGWVSFLTPAYLKKMYHEDPCFRDAKVVYTIFDNKYEDKLDPRMIEKLKMDNICDPMLDAIDVENLDINAMHRIAIDFSDAVVFGTENVDPALEEYVKAKGIPYMTFDKASEGVDAYKEFYNSLIPNED